VTYEILDMGPGGLLVYRLLPDGGRAVLCSAYIDVTGCITFTRRWHAGTCRIVNRYGARIGGYSPIRYETRVSMPVQSWDSLAAAHTLLTEWAALDAR